jgi:hypothetical protein
MRFANSAAQADLAKGSLVRDSKGRFVGQTPEALKLLGEISVPGSPRHQRGPDALLKEASGRTPIRSWIRLLGLALAASLTTPAVRAAPSRPPPAAACQAMQVHVAELIDQHRRADELDDASFGRVV